MRALPLASFAGAVILSLATPANAELAAQVGVYSDYRDLGVSWSNRNPALQASLDYAHENGWYLGAWASNVDYGSGDDARVESNFYVGYHYALSTNTALWGDFTELIYLGESDYNYQEYTLGLTLFERTELSLTYTQDYSGSELANYALLLSHNLPLGADYQLNVSLFRQQHEAVAAEERLWDAKHNYYNGVQLSLEREWYGFNWHLSASTTSIQHAVEDGKSSLVLGISKAWGW